MRSLVAICGLLLCAIIGLSGCGGGSGDGTPSTNRNPTITVLQASSTTIPTGGVVTLNCIATDPDGDPLSYAWGAVTGTLTGTTATATWHAPSSKGTYRITCAVTDGKGGTAHSEIFIAVVTQIPSIFSASVSPDTVGSSGGVIALNVRVRSATALQSVMAEITTHENPNNVITLTMTGAGELYSGSWTAPVNAKVDGTPTTYNVRYTATDIYGNSAQSTALYVIVEGVQQPPPFPNI